jgi:hypothetical protein
MQMKLKPEELSSNGYVLLDSLAHKEIVPFVQRYMKEKTFFSGAYVLANVLVLAVSGCLLGFELGESNSNFSDRLLQFSIGLGLAFALLPLHEYIHVLAYKSQGAADTSYGANLKKFYFVALANGFVASKKEFTIVALAPFLAISSASLVLMVFANTEWTIIVAGMLTAHTAMCSGDFALLSYFDYHRNKDVVTYDDVPNGISYFFGKAKAS